MGFNFAFFIIDGNSNRDKPLSEQSSQDETINPYASLVTPRGSAGNKNQNFKIKKLSQK